MKKHTITIGDGVEQGILLSQFPFITLNNGVKICNFSSAHPYTFETEEILPACTMKVAQEHKLSDDNVTSPRFVGISAYEQYYVDHEYSRFNDKGERMKPRDPNKPDYEDVRINYYLEENSIAALTALARTDLDVILVPYPVKQCIDDAKKYQQALDNPDERFDIIYQKARVCKKVNPRDISQGIKSTQFCI